MNENENDEEKMEEEENTKKQSLSATSRLLYFHEIQQCPESLDEHTIDASAADMWSIGMVLYEAMSGEYLFSRFDDETYSALQTDTLSAFLAMQGLDRVVEPQSWSLLMRLIEKQSGSRLGPLDAVRHCWFGEDNAAE